MKELGGSKIDDELMKFLWLHRLPEGTQAVLARVSSSMEALAAAGYVAGQDLLHSKFISNVANASGQMTPPALSTQFRPRRRSGEQNAMKGRQIYQI